MRLTSITRLEKWDGRFLDLAQMVSKWSKDPSTKVGAAIVRPDRTVASLGFNGFPRFCDDAEELYADRALKYERVVHAEMNALLNAQGSVAGCTLYVWPPASGPTCARCAAHVIQAGIKRVVGYHEERSDLSARWRESNQIALQMYAEAKVDVEMYRL